MARRVKGRPVENEERVAVAALRLANLTGPGTVSRFWVGEYKTSWQMTTPSPALLSAVQPSTGRSIIWRPSVGCGPPGKPLTR